MAAASGTNAAMTTVTYGSTRVSRPAAWLSAGAAAGSAPPRRAGGPPAPRGLPRLAARAGTAGTRFQPRTAPVPAAGAAATGADRFARRADSQHRAARIARMATKTASWTL